MVTIDLLNGDNTMIRPSKGYSKMAADIVLLVCVGNMTLPKDFPRELLGILRSYTIFYTIVLRS